MKTSNTRKQSTWLGPHCILPNIGEPHTGDVLWLTEKQAELYGNKVDPYKAKVSTISNELSNEEGA